MLRLSQCRMQVSSSGRTCRCQQPARLDTQGERASCSSSAGGGQAAAAGISGGGDATARSERQQQLLQQQVVAWRRRQSLVCLTDACAREWRAPRALSMAHQQQPLGAPGRAQQRACAACIMLLLVSHQQSCASHEQAGAAVGGCQLRDVRVHTKRCMFATAAETSRVSTASACCSPTDCACADAAA